MSTKTKDNLKLYACIVAIVLSLGSAVYSAGALGQRVTNLEHRQDRMEQQILDELRYLRQRLDSRDH